MATKLRNAERLTDREMEVLKSLGAEWVRPMDIGGRDGSDHSRVLMSLVKKGRADLKDGPWGRVRHRYRHAELGRIADALRLGLQYANLYSPPEDADDDGETTRDRETIQKAIERLQWVRYSDSRF